MREIKFRAWDKKRSKWFDDFNITDEGNLFTFQGREPSTWDQDSIILIQYTGLKDRNGKEIYEGDIIKYHAGGIGEIFWDEETASFKVEWHKTGEFTNMEAIMKVSEIIGNRFENSELLEKEYNG